MLDITYRYNIDNEQVTYTQNANKYVWNISLLEVVNWNDIVIEERQRRFRLGG